MSNIVSIEGFYQDRLKQMRAIREAVANAPDTQTYGSSDAALYCIKCRCQLSLRHGVLTGYFLLHPHNDHCQNQFARFIHSRDREEALQGANLTEDRCGENAGVQGTQPGRGQGVSAQPSAGLAQPVPREHAAQS